jgi:DNA-directed RNA polymerase specialized sigma24 family protein
MGRGTPAGDRADGGRRTGARLTGGAPDVTALLREFIEQDYVRVVAAVGLITHDRDQAEDAVQAAMVRLLTERGPDDDTPVATWITATASTRPDDEVPSSPAQLDRSPAAGEGDQIVDVVQQLPLAQRQVAVMRYYLDAPVIDIATGMRVPEEQVAADLRAVGARLEVVAGADEHDTEVDTEVDHQQEQTS